MLHRTQERATTGRYVISASAEEANVDHGQPDRENRGGQHVVVGESLRDSADQVTGAGHHVRHAVQLAQVGFDVQVGILVAGQFQGRTQTMPLAIYAALESDLDAALGLKQLSGG